MAREPFAARLTSLWIGGAFYWIMKGFKGRLTDQFNEKFDNRNLWTGYVITLVGLVVVVVCIFIK